MLWHVALCGVIDTYEHFGAACWTSYELCFWQWIFYTVHCHKLVFICQAKVFTGLNGLYIWHIYLWSVYGFIPLINVFGVVKCIHFTCLSCVAPIWHTSRLWRHEILRCHIARWMYRTGRMKSSVVWPRMAYIPKAYVARRDGPSEDIPSRNNHLFSC